MGKVGFELQPLANYVLESIKQGERIFADETTLPTPAHRAKRKRAYGARRSAIWRQRMVTDRFEDSRGGECVERHLVGSRTAAAARVAAYPCRQPSNGG
jgi:hypothetical protein